MTISYVSLANAKQTVHSLDITPVISYNSTLKRSRGQEVKQPMYSTKVTAERLGLSQDHVRLLARKGIIKAKKLGHDWVVLDLNYTRKRKPKGDK